MRRNNKKILQNSSGQALITLLVFVLIAITVTSAAIIVIYVNSIASSKFQEGINVYVVSESGLENGILRLLRDPSYTGETVAIGSGSATITVSGTGPWTIHSVGRVGEFVRTVSVDASISAGTYSFSNWKEVN